MIHVEVDSATICEDSVQRVPLNAYVMDKFCLHIEIRYEVFGAMTDVRKCLQE